MTEGEELLLSGKITFPRPDKDLLNEIKNGIWTYEKLMEKIENYDKLFERLYEESPLQYSADVKKIDELCIKLTKQNLFKGE